MLSALGGDELLQGGRNRVWQSSSPRIGIHLNGIVMVSFHSRLRGAQFGTIRFHKPIKKTR